VVARLLTHDRKPTIDPKFIMRIASSVLSSALLYLAAVAAADEGSHSERFDETKYRLQQQLLITPTTHPNLFSV
jgi:hypothetical protein